MNLEKLDHMISAAKAAHNEYSASEIEVSYLYGDEKSATLITLKDNQTATVTLKNNKSNGGTEND